MTSNVVMLTSQYKNYIIFLDKIQLFYILKLNKEIFLIDDYINQQNHQLTSLRIILKLEGVSPSNNIDFLFNLYSKIFLPNSLQLNLIQI